MPGSNSLSSIQHIVVLMLENRSFDHMLGFLYAGSGNLSPAGQPYDGLTGTESNPASSGPPVTVFKSNPRPLTPTSCQARIPVKATWPPTISCSAASPPRPAPR
jgi:phospholipase C